MSNFLGKAWCFTLNNPTIEQLPPNVWPDVQYVIWQHEMGDEATEHIQGYVYFSKRKRIDWLKTHTVYEAHWEPRLGTHTAAKHYCMKPVQDCDCKHCVKAAGQRLGGFWEHGSDEGIPDGQGKRSDILACKEMLDNRATEEQIADAFFGTWSRNYKAFERYRRLKHGGARNWITRAPCTGAPQASANRSVPASKPVKAPIGYRSQRRAPSGGTRTMAKKWSSLTSFTGG